MIPGWKLRREAARVLEQLSALPAGVAGLPRRLGEPLRRRRHERTWRDACRRTQGEVPFGPRVAIFLVFQPRGLPGSVILTCAHLRRHGHAILVVANSALDEADRARLAPHVWRILERPNFGYDFGGYRDGIFTLQDHCAAQGCTPERVLLLNDSAWFPLRDAQDTLARLAASEADVTGININEKSAPGRHAPQGEQHVESWLYMIPGATFRHPAFAAFWRDYRMSDDKGRTIRAGEVGFSRAMAAAGLTLAGLVSRPAFRAGVRAQDDGFLRDTLHYASYIDGDLAAERETLLAEPASAPGWRERALAHIERVLTRRGFHAYCFAIDRLFGTPALKKQAQPFFRQLRRLYLEGVDAGVIAPPDAPVLAEIRADAARAAA